MPKVSYSFQWINEASACDIGILRPEQQRKKTRGSFRVDEALQRKAPINFSETFHLFGNNTKSWEDRTVRSNSEIQQNVGGRGVRCFGTLIALDGE